MHWKPGKGLKPILYRVVAVRYKGHDGQIVNGEGFWTGQTWRILGDALKLHVRAIEWAYTDDES